MSDIQTTEDLTPKGLAVKRGLDTTKLTMVPRHAVATSALTAMDAMAHLEPEEMVLGAAVLFAAYCKRTGLDASEVHTMALRVLNAPTEGDHRTSNALQVLQDFAGARIMAQQVTVQ